jgi:DNA-binding transcriptional ArsR family regulator
MKQYSHPALENVALAAVMQALSDPWRLKIVRQLLGSARDMEFSCGEFPADTCKATRSHHFQVLREAGLVRMRGDGNKCMTSLRREEIENRFPGLLGVIAAERAEENSEEEQR